MYLMHDEKIELLGESVDDAIGEAFDKTAKLIGLGYPGGARIEELAKYGDENYFKLPKPLLNDPTFNFSFSGIKTHINLLTKKNKIDDIFRKNISSSFQKTITEIIISKIEKVLEFLNTKNISLKSTSIVGGVANNFYIRRNLENLFEKNIELYYPIKEMMSDNAAMIAWACIKNYIIKMQIFF